MELPLLFEIYADKTVEMLLNNCLPLVTQCCVVFRRGHAVRTSRTERASKSWSRLVKSPCMHSFSVPPPSPLRGLAFQDGKSCSMTTTPPGFTATIRVHKKPTIPNLSHFHSNHLSQTRFFHNILLFPVLHVSPPLPGIGQKEGLEGGGGQIHSAWRRHIFTV